MTRHFLSHIGLALAGLLAARVSSSADTTGVALAKSEIVESNVVYLRVGQVAAGLPDEIGAATRALTATNKIAGMVLDLRLCRRRRLRGGCDGTTAALLFGRGGQLPRLAVIARERRRPAVRRWRGVARGGRGLIIGNPTRAAMTTRDFPEKRRTTAIATTR